MPIYTYECQMCSEKFDALIGVNQDTETVQCPKCNSKKIKKGFAAFAISGSNSKCSTCSGNNCSSCH